MEKAQRQEESLKLCCLPKDMQKKIKRELYLIININKKDIILHIYTYIYTSVHKFGVRIRFFLIYIKKEALN